MKWTSICRWRIDIDLLQGLGQEYWARLHGATRHSALWTHDWLKFSQKKSSPILCCHTDPDTFIHYSRSTIAFRCNFLQFDLHLLKSCVVDTDNLESSNQLRSYSLWKSWQARCRCMHVTWQTQSFCLLSSGWPQPNNKCLLKPIFEFWELSWENIRKKCSDLASTNHYFSKTILKPKLCNNMIEEKSAIYWLTVKIINPENNTTLYIKKNWHPVIKTLKHEWA